MPEEDIRKSKPMPTNCPERKNITMINNSTFSYQYLEIKENDFDEWVIDASSDSLFEALNEYTTVVEAKVNSVGNENFSTEHALPPEINDKTYHQELYANRISEIHGELHSRNEPVGYIAEGLISQCTEPLCSDLLYIDIESRSQVDLTKSGTIRYAHDATTEVICIAWAIGDAPIETWFSEDEKPFPEKIREHIDEGGKLIAWNSAFEKAMFDHVISKRHDCPAPSVENWRCAQAVSLTNGYSAKLEEAAKALNLPQQKLPTGKHLIKTYCAPNHQTEWEPGDKELMANYCKADVEAMRSMLPHFRQLTNDEWHEYTLTQRMNDRGIPVDLSFVGAAWELSQKLAKSADGKIEKLTDGLVLNAKGRKTRDEFINPRLSEEHRSLISNYSKGMAKLSFDKENRAALLLRDDLDPIVRRYLELVDEAGSSSLTKYCTILDTESDSCVHGALRFNGASTGRYTSQGLQIHNISKDCFPSEEVEQRVARVTGGSDMVDPGISLARLTRAAIYHPDGLYWVDLSGIESRVEPWLANDPDGERLLDVHRQGTDIYQVTAAEMFNKIVEKVSPDQRNAGKVAVLACGYGGGKSAIQIMAKKLGLVFSDGQARSIVKSWRRSNPWAVRLWAALEKAVQNAVRDPGVSYWAGRCEWYSEGAAYLWCKLPSGRLLAYPQPKWERHTWLGETKYGPSYQTTDRPKKGHPPVRRQLHRGILSNNITQAVAADLLRQAIVKAEDAGLDIRLSTPE
ncbi:MAG: hypothetical protein H8E36_04875 [Rhodospirillaceae bacterium]|nr:hypothetical protein [Rhodospirillaceae bacterium]